MRHTLIGAAVIAGLALSPSARGADTRLLAGVGSLSSTRDDTPVVTLKGDATTVADTVAVAHGGGFHGGGFHGGGFHGGGAHFGGFHGGMAHAGSFHGVGHYGGYHNVGWGRYGWGRPFYHGGYGRWGYGGWGWGRWGWGGYRPWFGYYRPWGWYRPWFFPGIGVNIYAGGYPYYGGYYGSYPAYYSSASYEYPVVSGYAAPAYGCDCVASAPAAVETGPVPRPTGGYRYDGGPRAPVPQAAPLPKTVAPPAITPPPPTVDAVARRPVKKLDYPAYGESPGNVRPTKPVDPLLVKDTRNR